MTNSEDPDRGVLRRSNGTIYNGRESDFLDSINSQKAKDLRIKMLNGQRSDLCRSCWQKEDLGLKSKRQVSNRDFSSQFDEKRARAVTAADGTVSEYQVSYLDLRFGNLCNLRCIMCHPSSSSSWYSDYQQLFKTDHFTDTGDIVKLKETDGQVHLEDRKYFSWYESPDFWEKLDSKIDSVRQIYLVGGEPLLIQEHLRFLQRCVERGRADQMILEYDTNLTHLNQKILELWKRFRKIKLRVSVESTHERNNYIRFPSQWTEIEKNISIVESLSSNIEIDFSITWQIYNLFSVSHIWDLYPDKGSVRVLTFPNYLDIQILPRSIKEKALAHFDRLEIKSEKVRTQVASMKKYLSDTLNKHDPELVSKFKSYTLSCDQLRKTNAPSTFPELAELLA